VAGLVVGDGRTVETAEALLGEPVMPFIQRVSTSANPAGTATTASV
jgi:hypothetical protein